MDGKIVLIDGHSLLFRAFYGMPLSMTAPDGTHTNAVYGFLVILRKILEEEKPDYLAVAFDRSEPTFRHTMYEPYKGTRSAAPPEFHEQTPLMREVLEAMQIPCISLAGWEADDILGTLARRAEAEGVMPVIVSGDRDLLQIATDKTEIVIPKTRGGQTTYEHYFADDVKEAMGVSPLEFIDMKALMGDTSDNIPGLPGVGPKTAQAIIEKYHSIEEAYAHVDEIKPPRAQNAMREHYELAELSKVLATIRTDAPVEQALTDLAVGDFYNEAAYELFRRLNFKSLLGAFSEKKTSAPETPKAAEEVRVIRTAEEADALVRQAGEASLGGVSLLAGHDRSFAAAIACDGEASVLLPSDDLPREKIREVMTSVVKGRALTAVCGAKNLIRALGLAGSGGLFDVIIAAYLLNPLKNDWTYDDIASSYLNRSCPNEKDVLGKEAPEDLMARGDAGLIRLLADMALTAADARSLLEERLGEEGMLDLFKEVEMPLTAVLASMEKEGILASQEALKEYGDKLTARIEELTASIYQEAGETFNINSPKQLAVILFEKLKLPGGKKTKTGYSTAADVLEKLAPDHKIVADILEYRTYAKLKSTYADGLQTCIASDGRIHTTFHQTITATGRLSSTEPNLQNIPMREELGRQIRRCFFPREGWVFVDADYSQIELRVLAHMSGDEKLIEAYREEKDIHRVTASQVFHVPFEEVTPTLRSRAKAVNFGIVYGQSSFGLSQGLDISRKEAADYIEQYFATYPSIKAFLDGLVASAKEKGYAVSLFGRRRPVPELKAANFMQRSFGERVAMNSPIQGTAADIIKMAMNRVYARLSGEGLRARLILQIHDELLIEAPEEEAEKAKEILTEEMQKAAELSVRLETDCHIGTDWYEAK